MFQYEWILPHDSTLWMLIYAMLQELATFLHYRNLRAKVGDAVPALSKLLDLIAIDERAHHTFYRRVVQLFMEIDRPTTVEQLRRVLLTFAMPAVHMLAESRQRIAAIKSMGIFDEDTYLHEVYAPILNVLGVDHQELRRPRAERKARVTSDTP